MAGDKIFFASDFHLGLAVGSAPLEREKRVVKWLQSVSSKAAEIYLIGDIFDFWWEYKKVVPKGFTRFLGTVSALTDLGIPVHFFGGNHDMWVGSYLRDECGMIMHDGPIVKTFNGRTFYLAHGEGLGSADRGYHILLALFRNKTLQALYSALHPSIGMWIGHTWSHNSRLGKGISEEFMGEEKEDLFRHTRKILETQKIDYFIYGHRHLPMSVKLEQGAVLTILGDWIKHGTIAVWDGNELSLETVN